MTTREQLQSSKRSLLRTGYNEIIGTFLNAVKENRDIDASFHVEKFEIT